MNTPSVSAPVHGAAGALRFVVHGTPAAQGSHKAFVVGGRARITEGNSDAHALWRNQVTLAALNALDACALVGPLDGPLELVVEFRYAMPKSRPKRVRDRGVAWKTTAPDTDKLVRSIGDSLTAGGIITDDARIAHLDVTKLELVDGWTGADITVRELPGLP